MSPFDLPRDIARLVTTLGFELERGFREENYQVPPEWPRLRDCMYSIEPDQLKEVPASVTEVLRRLAHLVQRAKQIEFRMLSGGFPDDFHELFPDFNTVAGQLREALRKAEADEPPPLAWADATVPAVAEEPPHQDDTPPPEAGPGPDGEQPDPTRRPARHSEVTPMSSRVLRAIDRALLLVGRYEAAEQMGFPLDQERMAAAWPSLREALAEVVRLCEEAGARGGWRAWEDIRAERLLRCLGWDGAADTLPTAAYFREGLTRLRDWVMHDPPPDAPAEGGGAVILSLGEHTYRIGEHAPRVLTAREDATLQAFLERPTMDLRTLVDRVGYKDPAGILKRLAGKYGGIFAPAIRLPGGKGRGGYHVAVTSISSNASATP